MLKCRRRWKQWSCVLAMTLVTVHVLYWAKKSHRPGLNEPVSTSPLRLHLVPEDDDELHHHHHHKDTGEGAAAAAAAAAVAAKAEAGGPGGEQTRRIITPLHDPTSVSSASSSFSSSSRDLQGDRVGLRGLHDVDCVQAIEGFFPDDKKTAAGVSPRGPPVVSDKEFSERLAGGCGAFVERYGYNRYPPVSAEERAFPLAFNVLLYKEVEQFHVLLRAVYRPHNAYCLHVDGLAHPQVLEATRRLASCLPNVFLATHRENITYSGFSRLQADLNCMQDHLRRSQGSSSFPATGPSPPQQSPPWRYLLNLPSQDFPMKTNLELVKILKIYNGANDIEGITKSHRMLKNRYTFKHVYRLLEGGSPGQLQVVRTGERHEAPPHNITVVKGSAYGVFSREFVRYVLEDPRAQALLDWCRAVNSPDEYFWATLNHHNAHLHVPGAYSGMPDDKPWLAVYASWPPRDMCASGKAVRGVCIFGVLDLPQLVARPELFANKFYLSFQPETLHCMDQWLFNRTWAALPLSEALYYRKLPFIKQP